MHFIGKAQKQRAILDRLEKTSSDLDLDNKMEISVKSFQEERNTHSRNQCGKQKIFF